jgi:Fe-S-cluster containining protein
MSDKAEEKRKARDAKKAEYLRRMADGYAARFRAAAGEAAVVATEVHDALEEVMARDRARSPESGEIRCRKGCSHCCHGPVEIWPQEAVLLIKAAREAGIVLDTARLERQSRQSIETWRQQQPAADRACIFLGEDGACRVYASRPSACRKLLVTSDPALCDAENHALDKVERWFSWEAEVMETAALDTFGRDLMAVSLLAALKSKDEG